MSQKKKLHFGHAVEDLKGRLQQSLYWFPFPAFISFGLVFFLSGQILPNLNAHLGQPAVLNLIDAEPAKEGSIWLSMTIPENSNYLYVYTYDKKIFKWPYNTEDMNELQAFRDYLKAVVKKRIRSASLGKQVNSTELTAVIAVDQHLSYRNFRPVLNALAEAKITNYAFETSLNTQKM